MEKVEELAEVSAAEGEKEPEVGPAEESMGLVEPANLDIDPLDSAGRLDIETEPDSREE